MSRTEYETAVAAFIRTNGVTRCPTACALPTQAIVPHGDRAALGNHAARRERLHKQKRAAERKSLWIVQRPDIR
jgi:hypothetical protein